MKEHKTKNVITVHYYLSDDVMQQCGYVWSALTRGLGAIAFPRYYIDKKQDGTAYQEIETNASFEDCVRTIQIMERLKHQGVYYGFIDATVKKES